MARLISSIIAEAETRPNPAGGNGILYRQDMLDAMDGLSEPDRQKAFNELIDTASFIAPLEKARIKTDYVSY